MTNEIETRYLIVTLPDASGEEADSMVELIDTDVLTDGFTTLGTVEHALGRNLPDNTIVRARPPVGLITETLVEIRTPYEDASSFFTPADARAIAGALLRAAGEAEVVHGTCAHCGRAIVMDHVGTWVDPQAGGDDSMWRETCDENHGQFEANHDPVSV